MALLRSRLASLCHVRHSRRVVRPHVLVAALALACLSSLLPAAPQASATSTRVLFGVNVRDEYLRHDVEAAVQVDHMAIAGYFKRIGTTFPTFNTPYADGAVPMVAYMAPGPLSEITAGKWDASIRQWLTDASHWKNHSPVYVRLLPEMNVKGQPYAIYQGSPNTAAQYVAAWRRIVSIGRQVGATNVKWVWNPYRVYSGSVSLTSVWPGATWVDWTALDIYNYGDTLHGGWLDFSTLISSSLKQVRALPGASTKPFMLGEVGCRTGSKQAAWLADMLAKAPAMNISAVVYFNYPSLSTTQPDWRFTTTATSTSAVRTALHRSTYLPALS